MNLDTCSYKEERFTPCSCLDSASTSPLGSPLGPSLLMVKKAVVKKSKPAAKAKKPARAKKNAPAAEECAGPSFAEMHGLQEGAGVFQIQGGGLLMLHGNGAGGLMITGGPGPGSSALDQHPALRQRVDALTGLFHDCTDEENFKPLVKQKKEAADVVAQLEKLAKKVKDTSKKNGLLSTASDVCCRQAVAFQREEKHKESLDEAKRALELAREAGDEEGQAFALSGLGDALDSCGKYREAIEVYEQRCDIAQRHGDWDGLFTGLHKLAVTHVSA